MKKLFPLYINILTVFSILSSLIVFSVISYGHVKNSDIALMSAEQLISQTGSSIGERTQNIFDSAFMTVNTYSAFPEIGEKPSLHSHPMTSVFFKCLQENPNFTSIYIGFADGDFYLVSSLYKREQMKDRMQIPEKAFWYTQYIGHLPDGKRYELKKYLDKGFVTVGSSSTYGVKYDPRKRPWFKAAQHTDRPMLSDIYGFSFTGEPGITVSNRFDGRVQGVVGVDISLASLSSFMSGQLVGKECEIIIFDSSTKLYGYHDLHKLEKSIYWNTDQSITDVHVSALHNQVLDKLVARFNTHKKNALSFHQLVVNERKYISLIDPLPSEYGKKLFVAVVVPESFFTAPIAAIGENTLLVSLGILALFTPAIFWVSKRLSQPLRELTEEAGRIREFRLDKKVEVQSSVSEIRDLSRAMETMRSTLNSFGRYVPRSLVESMIINRIVPELGGERKTLTIMFSDIKEFTSISETMSPENLTSSITDYLKTMSRVILGGGGTIDKYIGDAIMCFWNAPGSDPDHARNACISALECRDKLKDFNKKRSDEGAPQMLTRMGLHTGETVVGNIGSSDRMDYTAMGAAVNLASRLEGLNKYLGTEILVSENTARQAGKGFLFRFAGKVIPKGTTTAQDVYELVGSLKGAEERLEPYAVPQETIERIADWEIAFEIFLAGKFREAADSFEECLTKGPDPLVTYYLQLARKYVKNPPKNGWLGEVTFDAK